jgi:O-antigen/teichoic acid export membrane protein
MSRSGASTSRYGRSAALLTGAVGAAGLLTYAFFALASHALDREEYGRIVVLWSVMFIAISVLFRPVEQLLSRTIAELDTHGQPTGHVLRTAAGIQLGIAAAFTVAAFALRGPIQDDLFDGDALFFWALIASVLGFAAAFFARGYLAGSHRFGLYAALVLLDAVARMAFALVVAVGLADGVDPIAIGIALAPLIGLLALAWLGRAQRAPEALAASQGGPPGGEAAPEFTLSQGTGFAAAVLVIMLSEQVFLNSGPLFARVEADTAAAGFIFNVLMVVRAPVVLFQAVATSLLPHLTRMRSRGDRAGGAAFRRSVRVTLLAVAAFTALTLLAVAAAGPALMQLAFGEKFEYDRPGLLIVAAGMGLYLSATTLNQAVLAQAQARRAALCWAACALALLAWYTVPAVEVFRRVEVGFASASALLCLLLALAYRRPRGRPEDAPEPGSPRELELRLAAADDAV